MPKRRRTDGILLERTEQIYEYKLEKDGSITLSTPALELREFASGTTVSRYYFTVDPAGKTIQIFPNTDFLKPEKVNSVFRFLTDDDSGNRRQIAEELMRRAAAFQEKGEQNLRRAEELRGLAEKI